MWIYCRLNDVHVALLLGVFVLTVLLCGVCVFDVLTNHQMGQRQFSSVGDEVYSNIFYSIQSLLYVRQ